MSVAVAVAADRSASQPAESVKSKKINFKTGEFRRRVAKKVKRSESKRKFGASTEKKKRTDGNEGKKKSKKFAKFNSNNN